MIERVDVQHHFWEYRGRRIRLAGRGHARIAPGFSIADHKDATMAATVQSTITVYTRQNLEETQRLLELALACFGPDGLFWFARLQPAISDGCTHCLRSKAAHVYNLEGVRE